MMNWKKRPRSLRDGSSAMARSLSKSKNGKLVRREKAGLRADRHEAHSAAWSYRGDTLIEFFIVVSIWTGADASQFTVLGLCGATSNLAYLSIVTKQKIS